MGQHESCSWWGAMNRLSLIGPLGLLFAASAPWTCSTYVLPDGGTSSSNTAVGSSGNGTQTNTNVYDASIPATTANATTASQGIADVDGGGVTVGPASDFASDFVYMSNASDGTVSRIVIPGDGGAAYEQARYFAVMPTDNHGKDMTNSWQHSQACNSAVVDAGCVDGGAKTPTCSTAKVDAGCVDAGQKLNCTVINSDGGCVDAGQKPLVCTNATVDAGCVDAGQKTPVCTNATVDAGCVDAGQKPPVCVDAGSGELCIDAGPKAAVCSTATVDAGCVDAGPKAAACSTATVDAGCVDGGPKAAVCTTIKSDGGCTDGGPLAAVCTQATVDAGCLDAGFNPPVCSTATANVCTYVDQLYFPDGGLNSPSRTVVDRNGNVFVVLRAPPYPGATSTTSPNLQAGVTKIVNVGDHPEQCVPRCSKRSGLAAALPDGGSYPFTMGVALPQSDGGWLTLLPSSNAPIAAGTTTTKAFTCLDKPSTYTDESDPTNYDDCVVFSIPLGDPNLDTTADPNSLTAGASFGRAGVVAPNCDAVTHRCDVWVGLWSGAKWVQLAATSPYSGGMAYDVSSVTAPGVQPYGATVDCRGILWSVGQTSSGSFGLAGITTVAVNDTDDAGNLVFGSAALAILTGDAGIVNSSDCTKYGIASDPTANIWLAAGTGGAKACSFNSNVLLKDLGNNPTPATAAVQATDVKAAWQTYDFTSIYNTVGAAANTVQFSAGRGALSRGINLDRYGNVYMGMDTHPWSGINPFTSKIENGMGAVSFYPTPDAGGGTVPCASPNSTSSTTCTKGQLNWAYNDGDGTAFSTLGGGTIGVDIDNEDRPWFGNFGGVTGDAGGLAVQLDPKTGAVNTSNEVAVGQGVYSYSDFTGYALRHITLSDSTYETYFQACQQEPELTSWTGLDWSYSAPAGTDMSLTVAVVNALDNATLNAATYCAVCTSVAQGCTSPFDLTGCKLPQGSYLVVNVTLRPKACDVAGTAPILYSLTPASQCAGN
jgi:hypothetical protein